MYWNSSLFIQHDWWGPHLFWSSCLPYQNCSSSRTSSEWIIRDNCQIHIQAWYGNAGWVSQIVLLSIHLIIFPARAKLISICFFHNFKITRPHLQCMGYPYHLRWSQDSTSTTAGAQGFWGWGTRCHSSWVLLFPMGGKPWHHWVGLISWGCFENIHKPGLISL